MTDDKMKKDYFEILKDIVRIPSVSGKEKELAEHIIKEYKNDHWCAEKDDIHNVYFRRKDDDLSKSLPLILAHLDTHPKDEVNTPEQKVALRKGDLIRLEDGKVVKSKNIHAGFDDKAGVAAILYLMKYTELKFRALFVVQEEKTTEQYKRYARGGGGGITYVLENENSFGGIFDKTSYVISLDRGLERKNSQNEIISEYGGGYKNRPRKDLCRGDFLNYIIDCSKVVKHEFKVGHSDSIADVYNVRMMSNCKLNCVNLSIGFNIDKEHSGNDELYIDKTIETIEVVRNCMINKYEPAIESRS